MTPDEWEACCRAEDPNSEYGHRHYCVKPAGHDDDEHEVRFTWPRKPDDLDDEIDPVPGRGQTR